MSARWTTDDVPGQQDTPVQRAQQRRELWHLIGFRADQGLGDHRRGLVGGGGQQVRDQPVRPRGAADRLAVHRQRRQPPRARCREGDRPGRGAAGQELPGVISQGLRADRGEDPHDGVRVRRHARPQRAAPAAQRGQHVLPGRADPGRDVFQRAAPAQRRRRGHRQDRRQGVPYPARVPRIRYRREASQQVPAAGGMQAGGPGSQLIQGVSRSGGHGHGRLDGQRDLRPGR